MRGLNTIIRFFGSVMLVNFCCLMATAQVGDSIAFQTDRDTTVKYVSPLEYAFMMHEETKFMLRVPVFGVGAELEILPYFTWMTQVYYPLQLTSETLIPDMNSELRWYYGSRDLGVRNMSGNYLAAGVKFEEEMFLNTMFSTIGYYGRWGMQRRILGNGLADIGFTAGVASHYREGQSRLGFFVESPVSLGLGFVFGERASLDRNRLCPVVKCHDVERFLFKINFSNLLSYNYIYNSWGSLQLLNINPNIALEKKIFNYPFSLNLDLRSLMYYEVLSVGSDVYTSGENNLEITAGLRWYYNMNRRIRLGKGGNGLSGNYIAAGVGGNYHSEENYYGPEFEFHNRLYPFVSTGIQRTLGRRLYYDLNIGFRYASRSDSNLDLRETIMEVYGNAQIGVKF